MAPDAPNPLGRVEDPDSDDQTAVSISEKDMEDAVEQLIEEVGVPLTQPRPLLNADSLRGRVAIVTGGSTGIGRAIAKDLAANGVHIAFNFIDDGANSRRDAQDTARELRQMEVRVYCRACDVREPRDVEAFVSEVEQELGGLHILVNNAGIGADHALWRMDDDEWQSVVRTNLDGCFYFIRAVAPFFREQEEGKIVNIASVNAVIAVPGQAHYVASKGGIAALTKAAAIEGAPLGVRVNAIAPGPIRTPMTEERLIDPEQVAWLQGRVPLGRVGEAPEMGQVAAFLLSDAASYVTGTTIYADGGWVANGV